MILAAFAIGVTLGAPPAGPRPLQVQRFAHYCDWHTKCVEGPWCDSWRFVSTIPFLRDALPGIGYRSDDPVVIHAHNREMWANGIIPLVSWWGPTAPAGGDAFLDRYLSEWDTAAPVKPGLLYEVTGRLKIVNDTVDFADPENAERFIADVRYLSARFWSRYPERFYRIDGRPVLFIWLTQAFRGPFDEVVARARREVPFYLIGSDFNIPTCFRPGLESIVDATDALSAYGVYAPSLAARYGGKITESYISDYATSAKEWSLWLREHTRGTSLILPLQFAFDDRLVEPPRNHPPMTCTPEVASRLAQTAHTLIAGSQLECGNLLPYVLFVSYNEHFEGTAAEPSDRYGEDWLNILRTTFATPVLRPTECP
jgi:hypothetical protein